MTIPEQQIEQLVKDASENIDLMGLYDECIKRYVDETALLNAENLTPMEIAVNFALAGYKIGVETALRYVELEIDEKDSPKE